MALPKKLFHRPDRWMVVDGYGKCMGHFKTHARAHHFWLYSVIAHETRPITMHASKPCDFGKPVL